MKTEKTIFDTETDRMNPDCIVLPMSDKRSGAYSSNLYTTEEYFADALVADLRVCLTNLRLSLDKRENAVINLSVLDTRTRNVLIKAHIEDYLTLSRYEAETIAKWRYCGKITIQNIIKLINEFVNSCEVAVDKENTSTFVEREGFYYSIAKIEEILSNKYYLGYKPTEDAFDNFGNSAKGIAENFINYFEAYKRNSLRDRDVEILFDYIFDDRTTMETVGGKYNLSRERIRQLLIKYRKRLKGCLYKVEYKTYYSLINGYMEKIPYKAFIHFIAFGFLVQYSKRFTLLILQCLFDNAAAENVLSVALDLVETCPTKERRDQKLEELLLKICFPSTIATKVNIDEIESAADTSSYKYVENFYLRLSRCGKLKWIIRKPKIVYYVSELTEHMPDFGFITEDNKFVLVVLLPTINMAIWYIEKI